CPTIDDAVSGQRGRHARDCAAACMTPLRPSRPPARSARGLPAGDDVRSLVRPILPPRSRLASAHACVRIPDARPPRSRRAWRAGPGRNEEDRCWAHQDSNLEPRHYDSPALTVQLEAPAWPILATVEANAQAGPHASAHA